MDTPLDFGPNMRRRLAEVLRIAVGSRSDFMRTPIGGAGPIV
jgi:hypothetical protein